MKKHWILLIIAFSGAVFAQEKPDSVAIEQYLAKKDSISAKYVSKAMPDSNSIDINDATVEQLMLLPGIGESTAKRIIENRPYANYLQLLDIKGIGKKKFGKFLPYITITKGEN